MERLFVACVNAACYMLPQWNSGFRNMKISTPTEYPEELGIFALTLNFYSSSAYDYVRKTFANCLPHTKTLQKWYKSVDGSPEYTRESLHAIEIKVKECRKEYKVLVCCLMMDEWLSGSIFNEMVNVKWVT